MAGLDASYSYRTYMGQLEGDVPSPKKIVTKARQEAKDMWGERPTLVIEPTIKSNRVGTWTHMAWFSSHLPVKDDSAHGSQLVVIWWGEMSPDTARVLDHIKWEQHAQDYWY